MDDKAAFLRAYSNEFSAVPLAADLSDLESEGAFSFARDFFFDNSPQLIAVAEVTSDEVASYERYLRQVRR